MDAIILIWIAIWGVLPPIVVAYFSFQQGKKGYHVAIKSRDEAMKVLNDLSHDVALTMDKLNAFRIPEDQFNDLLKRINKSISGSYGNLIKKGKNALDSELGELAEDTLENMSSVDKDAFMGQKILSKFNEKLLSFFD